jgi:hypothetical protein
MHYSSPPWQRSHAVLPTDNNVIWQNDNKLNYGAITEARNQESLFTVKQDPT